MIQPTPVAMAILYQNGKYLMQLRDDNPNILYPGHWGLFGGHLEPHETPLDGLMRELLEEITWQPTTALPFRCYADQWIIRHIFHAPLTVPVNKLIQTEGFDLALLTVQQITQGRAYSHKSSNERPLGNIHQKILLDFIAQI